MQSIQTNNTAVLAGKIESGFTFSHEVYGERFYSFTLNSLRLSGVSDYLTVTVSEQLLYAKQFEIEDSVYVTGQFRSYNNYSDVGNKLLLTVFAKDMRKIRSDEELCDEESCVNEVALRGYICKPPVYRTTPFGREITDLLVAVNRTYNKSDYIPCITWGRNAKFAGTLAVGDKVSVIGRMQSREYQKKLSETEAITKTAYEVSVSKISIQTQE